MKNLLVFSHKLCWPSDKSSIGYATDGGFVFHMQALASLFDRVKIIVPVKKNGHQNQGEIPFVDERIVIVPVEDIEAKGIKRKLKLIPWIFKNLRCFVKEIKASDAIHVPIPSDMGSIGMFLTHYLKKPLFIRYCGNWNVTNTLAEKFWKSFLEKIAGDRNLVLATGGGNSLPSKNNPHIKWIFSTSLTQQEIERLGKLRKLPGKKEKIKLLTVGRQNFGKGTDMVIEALSHLKEVEDYEFELHVLGDGPALGYFKDLALKYDSNDAVVFHGKQNHNYVINQMLDAHLFCFITKSEGFPKVILEAMASGLPSITSNVSVLPFLIEENHAGIAIKNQSGEELANSITSLINNSGIYQQMSKNAIQTAKQYTLENWADEIGEHLNKAWQIHVKREGLKKYNAE
jgi:glycosyltransferase involved in cell wall biosynthesis